MDYLRIVMFVFIVYVETKTYKMHIRNEKKLKKIEKRLKLKEERLNMNTVERLLKLDAGKLKTPTKDITITLKKLGEKFTFPCMAVDPELVSEMQENSIEFKKGDINKIKMYDTKVMTLVEGCPSIFKNQELIKHFGAATPKELVKKLLVSGEIDELKNEIDNLGGYDSEEEEEKEVKN